MVWANDQIDLHFHLFFHIEMAQLVEVIPYGKQQPMYPT